MTMNETLEKVRILYVTIKCEHCGEEMTKGFYRTRESLHYFLEGVKEDELWLYICPHCEKDLDPYGGINFSGIE